MSKAATATIEVTLSLEQIADTIRRLGRDGMRELIRLVPELREVGVPVEEVAPSQRDPGELRTWYTAKVKEVGPGYRTMQDNDPFLDGLTVGEYFALTDEEQKALWDRLYTEELDRFEDMEELDVPPEAVPAR